MALTIVPHALWDNELNQESTTFTVELAYILRKARGDASHLPRAYLFCAIIDSHNQYDYVP